MKFTMGVLAGIATVASVAVAVIRREQNKPVPASETRRPIGMVGEICRYID